MSRPPNLAMRERILESAHDLIYRNGFKGVSMEQIADASGLKKANLFHYFPTKDLLAVAVFDFATRGFEERWSVRLTASTDPVDLVQSIFDETMRGMSDCGCNGGCFIGNLAQELSDCNETVRQRVANHWLTWQRQLSAFLGRHQSAGYFRPGFQPADAAQSILALFQGTLLFAKATRDAAALGRSGHLAGDFLRMHRTSSENSSNPSSTEASTNVRGIKEPKEA
jgi:TetR/AcrR family transcriptional repressor of nem operon